MVGPLLPAKLPANSPGTGGHGPGPEDVVVADADLHAVLGVLTPIALITAALSGGLYAVVSRFLLHRDGQRTTVIAMCGWPCSGRRPHCPLCG